MKEDPKMDSKTNGFLDKLFELQKNKKVGCRLGDLAN